MNEADAERLSRLIDNEVAMLKANGWTEEARRHDFAICSVQLEDRVFVCVVDPLGRYVGLDIAILVHAAQQMQAAMQTEQPAPTLH